MNVENVSLGRKTPTVTSFRKQTLSNKQDVQSLINNNNITQATSNKQRTIEWSIKSTTDKHTNKMIFGERRRYKAIPQEDECEKQRPSLALFRQWSSTNSNSSTITVDNQPKTEFKVVDQIPSPPPQVAKKKRVTFSESLEVAPCETFLYVDELHNLWYTEDEMDEFWEEFMDITDELRDRRKSWVKSIQKTFASLSDAFTTPNDILQLIYDESSLRVRADRLGMERHVLDPDERSRKKKQVREQVLYWQDADLPGDVDRAEKMRSTSRRESRPFVVFAYLVAERSALLED